jgi:ADP-ribose pyrophosphatase YjhB (NUDIX family)
MTGYPPRPIARGLVFDPAGRLFLIGYEAVRDVGGEGRAPTRLFWFMPGGGLEAGESYEEALSRELDEEIGVPGLSGPQVAWCDGPFGLFEKKRDAKERYFAVRLPDDRVDTARLAETESSPILDARWWTLDDLAASGDRVEPAGLIDLARRVAAGDLPAEPMRLHWNPGAE